MHPNRTVEKFELYIVSLWLLFLLIVVVTIDIPICLGTECGFIGLKALVGLNIVPVIALVFVGLGALYYFRFNYKIAGSQAYEREWRVFHQQAGTLYHYEPASLAGIYFGPLASDESVEIVSLIMQGQNPSVKFYRGAQSRTAFKLDFQEFKYLSHLEAKSRGLI